MIEGREKERMPNVLAIIAKNDLSEVE